MLYVNRPINDVYRVTIWKLFTLKTMLLTQVIQYQRRPLFPLLTETSRYGQAIRGYSTTKSSIVRCLPLCVLLEMQRRVYFAIIDDLKDSSEGWYYAASYNEEW